MKDIAVIWKNHTIKKVEMNLEQVSELFCGVHTHTLDENILDIYSLEDGYYHIEGVRQYFKIKTKEVKQLGSKWREISFPLRKSNVLLDHLNKIYEREEQEKLGEILAEITVFNNDLDKPLEIVDGVAKMKNYCHKTVELRDFDDFGCCQLYLDGKYEVEIFFNGDMDNKYSPYDGVEGYGWYETIKQAVKGYMNQCCRYPSDDEYYDVSCSNCGDGGCFHCEPHRFL